MYVPSEMKCCVNVLPAGINADPVTLHEPV